MLQIQLLTIGQHSLQYWNFRFKILSPKMGSIKSKKKIFSIKELLQLSSVSSYPSGRVKNSHVVSPAHFSEEGSCLPL